MYKIKVYKLNQRAEYKSNKLKVVITPVKGYFHCSISGIYRKKVLTAISTNRSAFELRVIVIYLAKMARTASVHCNEGINFKHINYAQIFGSVFD